MYIGYYLEFEPKRIILNVRCDVCATISKNFCVRLYFMKYICITMVLKEIKLYYNGIFHLH